MKGKNTARIANCCDADMSNEIVTFYRTHQKRGSWEVFNSNFTRAVSVQETIFGYIFTNCNFSGYSFIDCKFFNCIFVKCDFTGADFSDCSMRSCKITDCILPKAALPSGPLEVYKALKKGIAALSIPSKARRTRTIVGNKCRAEYAYVKSIESVISKKPIKESTNIHIGLGKCTYKVGEIVYPDKYDDRPEVECSYGISFFLTEAEALNFAHTYMGVQI